MNMEKKTRVCGAIIQARMGSSRLPGKVMMPMPYGGNVPVISQVINRLKKSLVIDEICLATTLKKEDDILATRGEREGIAVTRGNENDVLERYYNTAMVKKYDVIVRIPGDKPCLDPNIVDQVVQFYLDHPALDYVSNFIERTCSEGMEVEVFSLSALIRANKEAFNDRDREHVTTYMYNSGNFNIAHCDTCIDSRCDVTFRATLDTLYDYTFICTLYDYLGDSFTYEDIVRLVSDKPWLLNINSYQATHDHRYIS